MFDFERPNIEVAEISEDKKNGKFIVEPLERGYGITLFSKMLVFYRVFKKVPGTI